MTHVKMGSILLHCMLTLYVAHVQIQTAEVCGGKPADVIFVLDASTSIWGPDYKKQMTFVQDVVDEFDVRPTKTQCGLITFSDYVRVEFKLGSYANKGSMKHAIKRTTQLLGGTRTDLALERMRHMYEAEHRRGVPKLAVVLTDGESTYTDMTAVEAKLAHNAGITIFAIGIGSNVNKKELQKIASSEDFVFEVDTFDALTTIRTMLAIKACKVEDVAEIPITPPTKGCDGKPADVVFALDASSSIWEMDFDKQLSFVKDVVSVFEISDSATRVGVLTFGDRVQRNFYLHKYTDARKLTKAIGSIRQSRGNTNTAGAIRSIRKQFFAPIRARPGVVHIGIIITDGRSDSPIDTAEQARLARKDGIHLFAIGVGQGVDQGELYAIASQPAGQYIFEVNTYDALSSVKHLLAMKTCEVTEPPTTPKPTTTTTTTPPPIGCSAQLPADIIFAMPHDVSTVESDNVLKFVRNVTSSLDIDSSSVRFGLVPRHCYGVAGFGLKDGGLSKENVISKISSTVYKKVDSAAVVKYICDDSFQEIKGARKNSQKIGVLFVDTNTGPEELLALTAEVSRAHDRGIQLIIIGVGDGVSRNELRTLVSPQIEKNLMLVPNYDELRNVAASMARRVNEMCIEPFSS